MNFLALMFLGLLGIAHAQTTCGLHIPPSSGRVMLTYTPYVTPQVAPTSTIYRHIVTAWTYAVNCRYVAISQVDDNQPPTGAFTGTPITVDALTITRIGCLQETLAVTRRDMNRGAPMETPIVVENSVHGQESANHVHKRATMKENVVAVASQLADDIPPDAQGISVKAYNYLVQVNTALYALNLYNTGFNMSVTCDLLSDPITQARLVLASVDPLQAEAIVCYAAKYGLFFDMSNAELLSDLLGIIYSIEVKSGFTNNSTVICNSLRLGAAGFLGIDTRGIQSYICGDQAPTTTAITSIPSTTSFNTTGTALSGTAISGTVGTGGFPIITNGPSPLFPNTTSSGNSSHTAPPTNLNSTDTQPGFGTGFVTTPQPSGAALPTGGFNATTTLPSDSVSGNSSSTTQSASDSWNIIFPNATTTGNGYNVDGGSLPPSATASPYYDVWTTSTTAGPRLPRY